MKTLRRTGRWLRSRFSAGGLILGYHRVVDVGRDPLAMCVSPRHFEEHLAVLRRVAYPISLDALVRGLEEGKLPPRAVALTFDDGYADVLTDAQPLLEQYQIPASVFVVTGCLGSHFAWDHNIPDAQEKSAARALTKRELLQLADSSLLEIGAHSVTHPPLATLSSSGQKDEIEQSKAALEELLDLPVTSFSYPHGSSSTITRQLVKQAGYHYACTSFNDVAQKAADRFSLPRFWPADWDGDKFGSWLKWWLSR
jgi:peptidoglycan/xylan/chitin deacetylase (PgdA/CDA1 family)